MKKALLLLVLPLLFTASFGAEYTLGTGDMIDVSLVTKNGVLNFKTEIAENGKMKLYSETQTSSSLKSMNGYTAESAVTEAGNSGKDSGEQNIIGFISAEGKTLSELKEMIAEFYTGKVAFTEVEISLYMSRYNVYVKKDEIIFPINFLPNQTYQYYISQSQKSGDAFGDSVYVHSRNKFAYKSVDDTASVEETVILTPYSVFVTGEVKKAGAVPYIPNAPISSYIALAGGPTGNGTLMGLSLFSKEGKKKSTRSEILPYDIIVVPLNAMSYIRNFGTIVSILVSVVYLFTTGISTFF